MNCLVTGGSGFLGGHLIEALVKRGESVRVLVHPGSKTNHLDQLGVEFIHGDLGDLDSLKKSDGFNVTWPQYVNRLADIIGAAHPKISLPYRPAYFIGWLMERIYGALAVKSRPLLTRMAVELVGTDQGFSIEKTQKDLNHTPNIDFEKGMHLVENWLKNFGYI